MGRKLLASTTDIDFTFLKIEIFNTLEKRRAKCATPELRHARHIQLTQLI